MYNDRAVIVDTEAEVTRWAWSAQSAYGLETGGSFPEDWTHLNDVEEINDSTVMISLRNQNQVVFVNRQTGLNEERTLGAHEDRTILHRQHNPDYLEGQEHDAVLVADSENNRVVEYAWINGSWERTWVVGADTSLAWPRDADRLPNDNTLVTDTHHNRVIAVGPNGDVKWSVSASTPYEAERLETGDESVDNPMPVSDTENFREPASFI